MITDCDYQIGGGSRGDNIVWFGLEQFSKGIDDETEYSISGHKPKVPTVGQTISGEFEKSFIKFKIVSVKRCGNPKDMFFAKVVAYDQVMKEGKK